MAGLQDLCWYALLACRNTHEVEIFVQLESSVRQRRSSVLDADFPPVRQPDPRSCLMILLDQPRLDFCMTEMAFCFSILFVALPAPFRQRADGWLDFLSSTPQRFRRTLHLNDTLVFNDCMEWADSIMGWLSPRLARSKDSFSFLVNCAIRAIKGVGRLQKSSKTFHIRD